jgi:hypothetical protein
MPITADSVLIELEAQNGEFNAEMARSADVAGQAMSDVEQSAAKAEAGVRRSNSGITTTTNNARIAQLEFQHVVRASADAVAAGIPVTQVLASETGRLLEAAELAGGSFGRFAGILGGGWGLALQAAISLSGIFIARLFDTGDANESAAKHADSFTAALERQTGALEANIRSQVRQQAIAAAGYVRDAGIAQQTVQNAKRDLDATVAKMEAGFAREGPGANRQTGDVALIYQKELTSNSQALLKAQQSLEDANYRVRLSHIALTEAVLKAGPAVSRLQTRIDDLHSAMAHGRIPIKDGEVQIQGLQKQIDALSKTSDKATGSTSRASGAHNAHAAAAREDASATREAAKAQADLQASLDDVIRRFDPALAQARDLESTLDTIGKLRLSGLISDGQAVTYVLKAAEDQAKKSGDEINQLFDKLFQPPSSDDVLKQLTQGDDAQFEETRRHEEDLQRQRESNVQQLAGLYQDLFEGGTKSVWNDFKKMGFQVIAQVLARLTLAQFTGGGTGGGGIGSIFTAALSSVFGGGRASGGPVVAGHLYRVNEGGGSGRVEGFQPAGSGKIIPLGDMSAATGGGGIILNQTINVDASGVNPEGYAEHIRAAVRQDTKAIVGQASLASWRASPERSAQLDRLGT